MTTKTEKKAGKIWVPILLVACAVAVIVFGMSRTNMQLVDHKGLGQSFICDNASRTLIFENYVTAWSWLERIRWSDAGATYNISTHFTTGEPLALTYSCR